MGKIIISILFALCITQIRSDGGAAFDYGQLGADWPTQETGGVLDFPDCSLQEQSPIDLRFCDAVYDSTLPPIQIDLRCSKVNFTAVDTGKTVQFNLEPGQTVQFGPVNGLLFNLLQFHFHWGKNEFEGSEHYVHGRQFPLEIHFVTQNPVTLNIAVFGFLFEQVGYDNPLLVPLVNAVTATLGGSSDSSSSDDKREASQSGLVQLAISDLILQQEVLTGYYRYNGSFTTPPCTEGVIWTVFKDQVPISKNQLKEFRKHSIKRNYRVLNPLNGRLLRRNF